MQFLESKSIYYGDINLIAQPQNNISSRENILKELHRFIVSPMSAVVGEKFAIEALNLGLTVCLPRFNSIEDQKKILYKIYDECGKEEIIDGYKDLYVSVGLNDLERISKLGHPSILVDVANGYLHTTVKFTQDLQARNFRVMVGNVHSSKGINLYRECKCRIGIGQGSVCDTSNVTGYTRGQVTEIKECYYGRYNNDQKIIADGGIKDGGCAAKAFGLGADYVMLGGFFKIAEEAQNILDGEYSYWGGASYKQQLKQYGEIRRHSEGREVQIDKNLIKPLKELVKELWGGISSAVSYSGYTNLTQFIGNGVFELKK